MTQIEKLSLILTCVFIVTMWGIVTVKNQESEDYRNRVCAALLSDRVEDMCIRDGNIVRTFR